MKEENENHLDKIFQKGFRDPVEPVYREQDWNALEQMLVKPKKRAGALFWLPVLSSAAAILVVFGWWLSRPQPIQNRPQKQQQQLALRQAKRSEVAAEASKHHKPGTASVPVAASITGLAAASGGKARGSTATRHPAIVSKTIDTYTGADNTPAVKTPEKEEDFALTAVSVGINDNKWNGAQANAISELSLKHLAVTAPGDIPQKPKVKQPWQIHPQYALNVLGAPELNGVNSLQQTRSGTNVGLLFSAGIFNRLTISTGVQYSNKPYNSYFTNYFVKSFNSDLTSIDANCRVLDIPLNLDYQLFGNYRNKFSIGTGFSSYIMLHESYQYNYANPTIVGPVNYTVPYSNKYLFDILNLQATYTRRVNSKVGLTFTPYVKLPLTGIGANQARLQTTGVALGLNWNLNSLYKP